MDLNEAKLQLADPNILASFLADPKRQVIAWGLNPDDKGTAKALEQFHVDAIAGLTAAANVVGVSPIKPMITGIGFTCCNTIPTKIGPRDR